jgi:hypothetical protein
VARIPLRRADHETTQEVQTDDRTEPVRTDDRTDGRTTRTRERRRTDDFSTKIERAAERAADATRTAAAAAAAQQARARPRTSMLASLGLVLAVVAGVAVATGALAGLGVAIGIVALLVGLAGLAATGSRYRYLAGRMEATLAILISIAAIVIGGLALAGNLSWLDTSTDYVARLRDELPTWLT